MSNHRAQFAPVAPLALLNDMLSLAPHIGGGYHLLLAHEVVKDPTGWSDWSYQMKIQQDGKHHVIMDSSVIELGKPVTMDIILQAAEIVEARTIVLPDEIGKFEATQALVNDALNRKDLAGYELMFVPQGKTFEEYTRSLEWIAKFNNRVQYIGLPRDALEYLPTRQDLAVMSRIVCPDKPIHLLGMANHRLYDDFLTIRLVNNIMGIDSAVPVRAGLKGDAFEIWRSDYGQRGNYWQQTKLNQLAIDNIKYVRTCLRSKGQGQGQS